MVGRSGPSCVRFRRSRCITATLCPLRGQYHRQRRLGSLSPQPIDQLGPRSWAGLERIDGRRVLRTHHDYGRRRTALCGSRCRGQPEPVHHHFRNLAERMAVQARHRDGGRQRCDGTDGFRLLNGQSVPVDNGASATRAPVHSELGYQCRHRAGRRHERANRCDLSSFLARNGTRLDGALGKMDTAYARRIHPRWCANKANFAESAAPLRLWRSEPRAGPFTFIVPRPAQDLHRLKAMGHL